MTIIAVRAQIRRNRIRPPRGMGGPYRQTCMLVNVFQSSPGSHKISIVDRIDGFHILCARVGRERKIIMRRNALTSLAISLTLTVGIISTVHAAADAEFYSGKVIRILVGFSAGGGFDTYARSLSRYMGKYIPGNPTIIVENMPGA